MRETIKRSLEKIVDTFIDRIIIYTDYFILKKHISLSETAIFLFSLSWSIWFTFIGVYVSEMALSRAVWATIFMTSTAIHFFSFFFNGVTVRAYIAAVYSVIWFFLMCLSAYTGSIAPAVPTLLVFTFLSVFISVRLFRERRQMIT